MPAPLSFYEFFAGGGMARAGLGPSWTCSFANDFDLKKAAAYRENWGDGHLVVGDVAGLTAADLPGTADLAWASFPCQDLSLAGARAGLGRPEAATRSGTLWPFVRLIAELRAGRRAPRVIMLENVLGALRSHGGRDFAAICEALTAQGYRVGALVVDAVEFLPQSRPRVFFLACDAHLTVPRDLVAPGPDPRRHPRALVEAHSGLGRTEQTSWIWWRLPSPPPRRINLGDLVEATPTGVCWNVEGKTARLLELMDPRHSRRVAEAQASGSRKVATVYRRTRPGPDGRPRQRAEIRFDGVAGCLRTPAGGSSRQTLLFVDGARLRSRLISPREAARLMGLADSYRLPARYGDAYHLAGDGVCVPVVRFLAERLIEPLLASAGQTPGMYPDSGSIAQMNVHRHGASPLHP